MFCILFDSAHLGNPTKYAGRVFGRNIPAGWPVFDQRGDTFSKLTDRDNPQDFAPRFHPTAGDDQFNAATSPLNHTAAELNAEADTDFFSRYPTDPQTWEEADAMGGAWGGHPDRIED